MKTKQQREVRLPVGKPVFLRIATIPEDGPFEEMRRIALETFAEMPHPEYIDHFGIRQQGPPPLKLSVIVDCQGCKVAKGEPPGWTVDDLNARMPGMFGPERGRVFEARPVYSVGNKAVHIHGRKSLSKSLE